MTGEMTNQETIEDVAQSAWARTHRPARWLSCAETAKLVRSALKAEFPGVRFSVRSHEYAGGASIDVKWTDGPRARDVEPVAKQYQGGGFDGTVDLKYGMSHFMRPGGSVLVAHDEGTEGSGGQHASTDNRDLSLALPDDAELVRFGADFIFCTREISDRAGKTEQALASIRAHCTLEADGKRFGNDWTENIATAMAYEHQDGDDWKIAFQDRWGR